MPKPTPFVPKPAIEKLPLAVRKDLRDNYESKKVDFESQIGDLLGFPVTININANEVWAYAEASGASGAGSTLERYVEGFISALKSYIDKYGDNGKEYFKKSVTKSEITVTVNELGDQAESIAADVKDGVFRILFKQDRFGLNQSWLYDPFVKAIDQAPHEGFGLLAKHSIDVDYNAEIESTQEEIGKILNMSDVILDPNFEENYAKLLKKADRDWEYNFGKATYDYFHDGVRRQLENQGFKGDDMLQEGFEETITSKTIKLRIVEKTTSGSTIETVVENGFVYIQTTLDRWYYGAYEAGSNLLNLL